MMNQAKRTVAEERVLVLASLVEAGLLSPTVLTEAGLPFLLCGDLTALCRQMEEGAGVVLVSEAVLAGEGLKCLSEELGRQPPWSDLPILLLSRGAAGPVVGAVRWIGSATSWSWMLR